MKILRALIPAMVLMLFLPSMLLAAVVGEMEVVSGKVKLTRNAQSVVYDQPGTRVPVETGDRFLTGPNTMVKVNLRQEQEQVRLYSNSSFQVREHTPQGVKFYLNLGKAYFGAFIKKSRTSFNVVTPTAVVGVKGTEFVTGAKPDVTYLYTHEGTVGFSSVTDPGREILVRQGYASAAQVGAMPTPPVAVPQQTQRDILESDNNDAFGQLDLGISQTSGNGDGRIDSAISELEATADQQTRSIEQATAQPSGKGAGNVTIGIESR